MQEDGAARVFTGVGSRQTPTDIGLLMAAISRKLTQSGWTLRSGGADGADLAFESGADSPERQEIFLPYPGFNGSKSTLSKLMPACYELAAKVHPAWDRCSDFAKKAHARNAFQVMGYNLMRPADALICWTKDGAVDAASAKNAGGTRTAVVLANEAGIPVFNLQRPEVAAMFREWVGEDLLAQVKPALRMSGPPKVKQPYPQKASRPFVQQPPGQFLIRESLKQTKPSEPSSPAVSALMVCQTPRIRFRAPGR